MAALVSPNRSDKLRLVALDAAAPQVLELRKRRITIGTGAGSDLLLNERTASRRHAAVERRWRRWRLIDLGSTNGTYLNGRRVTAPVRITRGDELRFGNARFGLLAPGDDPSRIGNARSPQPRLRASRLRIAVALAVALLLGAGSFVLTRDLEGLRGLAPEKRAIPARAVSQDNRTAVEIVRRAVSAGTSSDATSAGTVAGADAKTATTGPANAPEWLARLNHYRAMLPLSPVAEDPALSEADALHSRYLVKSYADAIKRSTIGAEAHEENPSSPWYTPQGMRAGKSSDVAYWQTTRTRQKEPTAPAEGDGPMPWGSPGWSIDGWMGIPFHRLSLISPYLRRSGFGRYCEDQVCAAALDTLSEVNRLPEHPVPFAEPLRFPPPASTIHIRSLDPEWPDPLTACADYVRPAGLAVTIEIGANVDAHLTAYRIMRESGAPIALQACGFDSWTYKNPEAGAQERGRDILQNFGAAVVIPRAPLEPGRYAVSMTVNGQEYRWWFSIGS